MKRVSVIVGILAVLSSTAWSRDAYATVERFALIIGQNRGAPGEVELRYAEDDANKMYDVLRQLGNFRAEHTVLMRGTDAAGVRLALRDLDRRIRAHHNSGGQPAMLLVYYSGHADARDLHLDDTRLPLRELKQALAQSSAALRIVVLDSCRSGALTRVKGGQPAAQVRIQVRQNHTSAGTIFLTASSAGEDAQESDELSGSFFTHYLVSGLLGAADADSDGQVLLQEAYRYAYQHTLRASSRTLAGTQHPTFHYDVRGREQIVLTRVRLSRRRAIVQLPRDRTYLLFQGGRDGPVVAEVGRYDPVRRISVPAGRYFVRARAQRYLLEGGVTLVGGREQIASDQLFQRIDYARLVRKGVSDIRSVHGPRAGVRTRASLFNAGVCMGPYVGYAIQARNFTVVPRFDYCRAIGPDTTSAATSDATSDESLEATLAVHIAREWDLPWVTLGAALAPGVSLLGDSSIVTGSVFGNLRAVAVVGAHLSAIAELMGSSYAILEVGAQTYIQQKQINIFDASSTFRDPPKEVINELDAAIVLSVGAGIGVRF